MNPETMDGFYRHMSLEYGGYGPIAFDKKIVELGDILGKSAKSIVTEAKSIVTEDLTEELSVVLGYYSSDINAYIIPSNEKRKYPAYVQLNLLTLEFLSDFLLFAKYPDRNHCVYIFSKYRKNADNAAHRTEHAAYYNKLHRDFQYQSTFDWWNYVPLAAHGIYFLLFHEWAHTQRQLVLRTINLLQEMRSTLSKVSSLDGVALDDEEIACDFIALTLLDGALEKSKSGGDALRIAVQTLAFIPLYYLIVSFSHGGKDEYVNRDFFDEQLDLIDERLKIRLANLAYAVEIARIAGGLFQKFHSQSATEDTFRILQTFYERLSDFWVSELLSGFDAFIAQDIEERKQYYLSKNVSPLVQIY